MPSDSEVEKLAKKFTDSPGFVDMTKSLYYLILSKEIQKDPKLWETFSHEKQVELHKIKAELDKKFSKTDRYCQSCGTLNDHPQHDEKGTQCEYPYCRCGCHE